MCQPRLVHIVWPDLALDSNCALQIPRDAAVRCAAPAVAPKTSAGLLLPRGADGAWDQGAISSPVVRVYEGDNEQRWLMWYSGCDSADAPNGSLVPGAGKIGAPTAPFPHPLHSIDGQSRAST